MNQNRKPQNNLMHLQPIICSKEPKTHGSKNALSYQPVLGKAIVIMQKNKTRSTYFTIVLVRITIAVMKHHDQEEAGEQRII